MKRLLIIIVVVAGALLPGCEKKHTEKIVLPEGKTARVAFVVGDVSFRPLNATEWVKANVGDKLSEGTVIMTGENSFCELVISSGTIFRMRDRSELQLAILPVDERQNRTLLKLESGELFARVRKIAFRSRDSIQTYVATISSKSTDFLVSVDRGFGSDLTEVMVSDGSVRVNVAMDTPDKFPKEMKQILRRIKRGVFIKEGHKLDLYSDRVRELERMIDGVARRGIVDASEIDTLKDEIKFDITPFGEEDRERLSTYSNLSPEFGTGKTFYISPNFDGVNDEFILNTESLAGRKVKGWKLVVLDAGFRVQKVLQNRVSEEGEILLPQEIRWNMVNLSGNIVADGNYVYELYTLEKVKSYQPQVKGVIVVDTIQPLISLNAEEKLFSPNGDGIKDTILIKIEAEKDIQWSCAISTLGGIIVRTFDFGGDIPPALEWDGKGDNGMVLPEGIYDISFTGRDLAGNLTRLSVTGITLDVRERQASVEIDNPVFSPNGDGILDTVTFMPILSDRFRIDTWDLIVQTDRGETARRFRGGGYIPERIIWDGKPQKGGPDEFLIEELSSGCYSYFLKVVYRSGVNTYSFKQGLIIDKDPPVVRVEVEPELFSPDDDGVDDHLMIRPVIEDLTPVLEWKSTIYTVDGTVFKSFSGSGMPAREFFWDGVSNAGQLVDSGEDYYLVFEATDSGFNTGVSKPVPISIDILVIPTERGLKIRVSNIEFGFNTAELKGEKTFEILNRIVAVLKKYGRYSVVIEGHTDSTGDENYNLVLSHSRAEAVGKYLIEHGIASGRLRYEGYGSKYPVDTNETKEGRRRNRRVEFLLLKKR
ncbi:MAG: OmpA family protein [Spirochaetota bacterium]